MSGVATPSGASAAPEKERTWYPERDGLSAELEAELGAAEVRGLRHRSGARHLAIAARHLLLLAGALALAAAASNPWWWVPAAVWGGLAIFGCTVLLHEWVHGLCFARRRPRLETVLAWLYALPSGLVPAQYRRWHLDHHRSLGSDRDDPKRAWLTPRSGRRWHKLLYATPALVPIYFRAARREMASYPPALRREIARQRLVIVLFQLALAGGLLLLGGPGALLRAWVVPYFLVFPVAFTLNRIGQHYDIVPGDPRRSGTRVDGSWLSRLLFLSSNHHLEHHYDPKVPLYRLPRMGRGLRSWFTRQGIPSRSYAWLAWRWFVRNEEPHTEWSSAEEKGRSGAA